MRRILITREMVHDAEIYSKNLFTKKTKKGRPIKTPDKNIDCLIEKLKVKHSRHAEYLSRIKMFGNHLNSITPDKFEIWRQILFLTDDELSDEMEEMENKKFHDLVVDAMRYDYAKNDENLKNHFEKCGLKTCVYCNSQFAVDVEKTNREKKAHYELDHIWPKSKYPFLCTNFFNLVPCCGTCNRRKSDFYEDCDNKKSKYGFKLEELNLYTTNSDNVEIFRYYINEDELAQYWLSAKHDPSYIKVEFSAIDTKNEDLQHFYKDKFDIEALCNTHTDVIEELLWKKRIYNQTYITILEEQFGLLFPNMTDFNRFLLGNYDKPEDVHKRPLAKMIQDIARQLDMI